jgi:hypothetical protein
MPSTDASCPTTDPVRPAVMAPLSLGSHQHIVFFVNETEPDYPFQGTIKRRDQTIDGDGIELWKIPEAKIVEGQVSRDGNWILFVTQIKNRFHLKLVRADGQGKQTLYCSPINRTISNVQWSFDMQHIVFNLADAEHSSTIYLLDIAGKTIEPLLASSNQANYKPLTWLDNQRFYLSASVPRSGSPEHLVYLLDLNKGSNQTEGNLTKVIGDLSDCSSFDSSYDLSQVFVSECGSSSEAARVMKQPTSSNSPATIYQNKDHRIETVRSVRPDMLVLLVKNSKQEFFVLLVDGDGKNEKVIFGPLEDSAGFQLSLCTFSQYAWSNVSHDGNMLALNGYDPAKDEYYLYTAMIQPSGIKIKDINEFAGPLAHVEMRIIGWTTS